MVEVECRTCLEMSDLNHSFSISTKFLLGKSFKEVILLFVPQMVSAIWVDDIICSICSETLNAFALLIDQILAVEKVLMNYNRRMKKGTAQGDSLFELNKPITRASFKLNSQNKDKMQLQVRPIEELEDSTVQHLGNTAMNRDQSTSSCQDDEMKIPIKWVRCRTCLLDMSRLEPSSSLTDTFLSGQTFKDVILNFIPQMISVSWIDESLCPNCSMTLREFAAFIERCVTIEEIFKKADARIKEDSRKNEVDGELKEETAMPKTETTNSQLEFEHLPSIPIKRKWERQSKIVQDIMVPGNPNFDSNQHIRTYSRKLVIKNEVVEISDEEDSSEPILFDDTKVNVTDSVKESPIDCENILTETTLPIAEKDEIETLDEHKEYTKSLVQRFYNILRIGQQHSSRISAAQLIDTEEPVTKESHSVTKVNQDKALDNNTPSSGIVVKSLEHNDRSETNPTTCTQCCLTRHAGHRCSTVDRPTCGSTTSDSDDNVKPAYNNEASINSDYPDKNEVIEVNETFNVIKREPIYSYPIKHHDKVVSVPQSNEALPIVLEDLTKRNIPIYHYGKPNDTKIKRVLLLGSALVPCPMCKVKFNSSGLRSHMRREHGVELPKSQGYKSNIDVQKSTVVSDVCESEENPLYVYDFIGKRSDSEYTYPCSLCKTVTYSSVLLARHIRRVHKNFKPYSCKKCGKTFGDKTTYTLHAQRFRGFPNCKAQKCYDCSKMIGEKEFESHVKTHESYICEDCGLTFTQMSHLTNHRRKHQYENFGKVLCFICGKMVVHIHHHMKLHEPSRPRKFLCHKCPKSYMTNIRLNVHIKNCHQDNNFECKQCKKKCRTVGSLKDHIKLKHSEIYLHSCTVCGQQFYRGDYFRRHMRQHAEGRYPNRGPGGRMRKYKYTVGKSGQVKCKHCSKVFKSVHQLRIHLLTHVKTMRFACRVCNLSFSNYSNKCRHENRHKDPNFELKCKICWARMKSKKELEAHLPKHLKKYVCYVCGEGFARKYLLNHHIGEEHISEEEVQKEKQAIFNEALEEFLINKTESETLKEEEQEFEEV